MKFLKVLVIFMAFQTTACASDGFENPSELRLPDGSYEPAQCVYYSNKSTLVCESEHMVCQYWEGRDIRHCFLKPVKY